ncbi:hypothetical protein ACQ4PT_062804 [Festuca glaucescens]
MVKGKIPYDLRATNAALLADICATNAALLAFLRSIGPVKALVADFFCAYGFDAAAELGVPAYLFFASGTSVLAAYLHIPIMRTAVSFRDMGRNLLQFPGVHPIPASDLPEVLLDRDNNQYKTFLGLLQQLPRAKGILSNTFELLEPRAVKAIKDGTVRPGDSVPAEQLKEIAVGLERSGHEFLWAVRAPAAPDADSTKRFEGRGDAAVEALLPEGFLDRTRGRGMVVSSWAPQVEVLRHPATGAFVTHCGWNSTLEAVAAGVPMVC